MRAEAGTSEELPVEQPECVHSVQLGGAIQRADESVHERHELQPPGA